MKTIRYIFMAILTTICATAAAQGYTPDILGDGFEQRTINEGSDYSGEICATLVRATPLADTSRAVLYVHGYNDYFFQRELAEQFRAHGYNFFAVDLRKYGRSLREGQTPFEVREIDEYFSDIDAALAAMQGEGMEHITLMGHSTGGLITSLYCDSRRSNSAIEALILNSPFFDMNLGWTLETLALPIISFVGRYYPDMVISDESTSVYAETLLSDFHGEWSYNTDWKKSDAEPITAGWLRAIHLAQMRLQKGLMLDIPTLLLFSDRSLIADKWSAECQSSDIVLDVEDIELYGKKISSQVTPIKIDGGIHDLTLSSKEVRDDLYQIIFDWLQRR